MKMRTVTLAAALVTLVPLAASAQAVDQLVANPALLNAELSRCKHLGMASVDDARCRKAWTAENKRFFGNGTTYAPAPVNVFPDRGKFEPQPKSQKAKPKPGGSPRE